MRIVVLADSHQDFGVLYNLVQDQKKRTDHFLFLGDGERDVDHLLDLEPSLPFLCVRGNCDMGSISPLSRPILLSGVKIFMTHGHLFGVKDSLDELQRDARQMHASIVLYAHTHRAFCQYAQGLYTMNPGCLAQPRGSGCGFGVIEIQKGQIVCNLAKL